MWSRMVSWLSKWTPRLGTVVEKWTLADNSWSSSMSTLSSWCRDPIHITGGFSAFILSLLQLIHDSIFSVQLTNRHWECVPGSRRSKVESTRTWRLGFRPGDWQRSFECHKWSQMSVDFGRRAAIRQVVRSESVKASVYKGSQFESDTIWHLEPVQLSSLNFGNRHTMWELQQSCPWVGWTRGSGRVWSDRIGSGRVGSRFFRILAGRVGSAYRIF